MSTELSKQSPAVLTRMDDDTEGRKKEREKEGWMEGRVGNRRSGVSERGKMRQWGGGGGRGKWVNLYFSTTLFFGADGEKVLIRFVTSS
jgi:hypothetical protein